MADLLALDWSLFSLFSLLLLLEVSADGVFVVGLDCFSDAAGVVVLELVAAAGVAVDCRGENETVNPFDSLRAAFLTEDTSGAPPLPLLRFSEAVMEELAIISRRQDSSV